MSDARALVSRLYDSYQARDWSAAAAVVDPGVRLEMPATGEVLLGRDDLIGFQRRYPEPWGELTVLRVVAGDGDTAAAEIEIVAEAETFRCAAFWVARSGLLRHGVEYWVTVGADEPGPR